MNDRIENQDSAIAALERQIADASVTDLSEIEATQSNLAMQVETLQAELGDTIADLTERMAALERLPRGEGGNAIPAIAGYEAELDALRAQIQDMTDIATTELETARAEAAAIEENAASAARAAAGRAAVARIQTALESGAPLGAALGDLEDALGESAPDALLAVQDGVPTLADLQEQFPEYARAALTTARSEGVSGEETSGFGAFLRNQFDVRSVAPREGNGTDAILSRAEASLRTGRLSDTLAELAGLPEVARAEMSEWLALAEMRADAIAAADILSTSLIDN
ncbi:COG4223 family protein [Loktanella agnita]